MIATRKLKGIVGITVAGLSCGPGSLHAVVVAAPLVIERIDFGRVRAYDPDSNAVTDRSFSIAVGNQFYRLSDGSSWQSGAGGIRNSLESFESVTIIGNDLVYEFSSLFQDRLFGASVGVLGGSHLASYDFSWTDPVRITARRGSTVAEFSGIARLTSNFDSRSRFVPLDAEVGDLVPFHFEYRMTSGTWQPNSFQSAFTYQFSGTFDLLGSIPEPSSPALIMVALATFAGVRRTGMSRSRRG